jgi:uncharacterized protein YdhG (YjbR/CyaY superfamily)
MLAQTRSITTVDDYISQFPATVQVILQKIRRLIKKLAPESLETISYGMPTYKLKGNLVHFAGYVHHIGFYPGPEAIVAHLPQLKDYKTSTGAIQFPLSQEIPYELISKIVTFRLAKIHSPTVQSPQ